MVINLNWTTSLAAYSAVPGTTTSILFSDKRTDEKKAKMLGVSTALSATAVTAQSIASDNIVDSHARYISSLSDDELAYACELIEAKERSMQDEIYQSDMTQEEIINQLSSSESPKKL